MVFHRVPKNRQNAQRTVIPAMYRTCVFVGKRPAQRGKLRLVISPVFGNGEMTCR